MFFLKIKIYFWTIRTLVLRYLSKNISNKSYIARNVQIIGVKNTSIGENTTIGEGSLLTINNRNTSDISLKIGSNVYIGRDNFFTVGKLVHISDYCIIGNKCSFICSNHNFESPLVPYSQSGATYVNSISMGVNCWIGNNVSIIGNVKIGHGSIIGANSLVLKDIPPFCLAYGNPLKIVKRFDFDISKWVSYDINYNGNNQYYNESFYLSYLKQNFNDVDLAYHSSSSEFKDI
jgi:acetyltransferase-like isoleucine patch superfamily enzyme